MIVALKSGKVFAYGLDVYNGEPKIHPEYLKLKNIFVGFFSLLKVNSKIKRLNGLYTVMNLKDLLFKLKCNFY